MENYKKLLTSLGLLTGQQAVQLTKKGVHLHDYLHNTKIRFSFFSFSSFYIYYNSPKIGRKGVQGIFWGHL